MGIPIPALNIEVVGYVCDLKTLETHACVACWYSDQIGLSLVPIVESSEADDDEQESA